MHRDADGRTGCRDLVTGLHEPRVGALPGLDGHIELAGRISDLAKHRQICGGQEAVGVRLHEQVEGLPPVAQGGRVTCALDEATTGAIAHRTLPYPWPNRRLGQPVPEVTVRVTAVTVLLTHLGWGTRPLSQRGYREEDSWTAQPSTASSWNTRWSDRANPYCWAARLCRRASCRS